MKNLILFFGLFFTLQYSQAQGHTLAEPEAYFTALIVNDIELSTIWYTNNMGFKIVNKTELKDKGFAQVNLKRGTILLELIALSSSVSSKELLEQTNKTKLQGIFKFGFLIKDFDNWLEHLKAMDVEFKGKVVRDPETSKRMLIILDPDANRIQLFEK